MTWLIMLLALALRFPLMWQSLWLDESIEALALMGKMGSIWQYALKDFQPPLYHYVALAWTSLAGYSEFALRTPSLISGLLLVYFVLKFGRVLGGNKLGLIAGLLAATNPLLIYYSAEGRTYIMTAFFVTASFYYLYLLLSSKSLSKPYAISYTLFTVLSLWTSYIAWAVISLQFLYLTYLKRWDLLKWTAASLLTLIFWLPSFLTSLGIGLTTATSSPEWGRVVGGISVKALALTWVKAVIGRISFESRYLYGGVMLLMFFLHAYALRLVKKVPPLLFVWLGTILVAGFISLFVPVYSYFRVLFVLPAYLLLLSLGLSRLNRAWFYSILSAQLIFVGIYYATPRFHHEDWRSLVNDLNSEGGAVAMPSLAQNAPLIYYGLARRPFEPRHGVDVLDKRIYYLKYVEDLFDVQRVGQANLERAGYTIIESRTYPGLQLDIYENRP